MEPIKEEPEDFGTNSMMLNNIEQDPGTVNAGVLVLRDVEDQSQSDTMTLGETVDQSPTDDMSLDELEDFSAAFSGGALIDRDSDDHSEASTVILANRNQQPDTEDVAMTDALYLYSNANPSLDNDNDSDEENHLALTPEPVRTHRGIASSPFTDTDSDDRDQSASPKTTKDCIACQEGSGFQYFGYCGRCAFQAGRWRLCDMCNNVLPSVGWRGLCFNCIPLTESEKDYIWPPGTKSIKEQLGWPRIHRCLRCGNNKTFEKTCEVCWGPQPQEDNAGSSADTLNGSAFSDNATSSFGSYFVGNESQPGQYGVFPYNVVNPNAFQQVPFPHPGMMPAAPWPQPPGSQPLFPMLPEPLLPYNPYVVNPHQAPAGYPYVPAVPPMQPMQPMAFPTYYPPYVPFGYPPFGYQPVYQAPINHYGGTYPPLATERWNLDLPDTNAQRTAAAEYPVRTQTPYPPRYLPRNGSGFEYTGLASETSNWEPSSTMFEEFGTMNRPASVNPAITGSPLERGRSTEEPFESAHCFPWTEQ